jgi:hypothetical protein
LEVDSEMSKQVFDQVIQRASSDARFKASLSDNFDGAVRAYDLTDEERTRLAKGLGLSAAARAYAMPSAIAASAVAESALAESALAESALAESALAESALAESALAESALAESALAESALAESALAESALAESATTN